MYPLFFSLLLSSTSAFQSQARGTLPGHWNGGLQETVSLHAHGQSESSGISRRSALLTTIVSPVALIVGSPVDVSAAVTAVAGGAIQSARVATYPGIESLEPMYELKLSIDALSSAVSDPTNWPFVQRRLEKFFKGIFSEKNFYFGVGLQYMNEIQYDKAELPNYVVLDKEARFEALDQTMKALERLKNSLSSPNASVLKAVVEENAKESQAALKSWFDLLPQDDVKAVQDLFEHVQKADVNRDGKLSDDELTSLSTKEQELWKKRVEKFG